MTNEIRIQTPHGTVYFDGCDEWTFPGTYRQLLPVVQDMARRIVELEAAIAASQLVQKPVADLGNTDGRQAALAGLMAIRFIDAATGYRPCARDHDGAVYNAADVHEVLASQSAQDSDADHYTIMRMGELLASIAVALKGPEEARKRHGYQDLPQLVQAKVFEVAMLKQQVASQPAQGERQPVTFTADLLPGVVFRGSTGNSR